ncbi:MAG: hypothetical protein GY804_12645 [Alphaproteobacteria bacterium]|nr:hypothetical protein [Alphaproteobacteria bacterium]
MKTTYKNGSENASTKINDTTPPANWPLAGGEELDWPVGKPGSSPRLAFFSKKMACGYNAETEEFKNARIIEVPVYRLTDGSTHPVSVLVPSDDPIALIETLEDIRKYDDYQSLELVTGYVGHVDPKDIPRKENISGTPKTIKNRKPRDSEKDPDSPVKVTVLKSMASRYGMER